METQPSLFPDFKLGQPSPWVVVHRGIEYTGEVVVSDRWVGWLAEEIAKDDVHFRLVIFTKEQSVPSERIGDRRIAFCVPGRPRPQAKKLSREYLAVREERERYLTRADLEARESELRARVLQEQASMYAAGRVVTRDNLPIDPHQVFSAPDSERMLSQIVSVLLSDVYALLPLDTSNLRKTLSPRDPGHIFGGFFDPSADAEAKSALDDFAVGLGLARRDSPQRFISEDCPVFQLINAELQEHGGSIAAQALYHELGTSYGLTWPLITLYLLCFIHYGQPGAELRLKPEHELRLRSGERPTEDRLTSALVAEVSWRRGMEQDFDRLCYSTEPLWSTILPYARLLDETLGAPTDRADTERQEGMLVAKLEELRADLARVRAALDTLAAGLGTPPAGETVEATERLHRLGQCQSAYDFYNTAREEYLPSTLAQDLSLYQRLRQVSELAPEIAALKFYLEGVVLRESDSELAMDRVSILEQLSLGNLVATPHLWPSIRALFDWFKSRYRAVYQEHHRNYHRELSSFQDRLIQARPQLEALRRLNSIAELGEPLGEGLAKDLDHLLARVDRCPKGDLVDVEQQPVCSICGLILTASPPTEETQRFLGQLHQALRQQHRRLSAEAIRQILAQSRESKVDQFVKVIQSSDLSSLADVMDEELVAFLRQLLLEANTCTQWSPVLRKLKEKFPDVDEEQIEEAISEFAALLRESFDSARRENPGKRIRIAFE